MKSITANKQSGAVSLFVVIFAMLLITVVTVSFLRLMINDQQQASNSDLSQSAYDSAQAGVEDAKRALLKYQQDCSNTPTSCAGVYAKAISGPTGEGADCNVALKDISGDGSTSEIPVQQSLSGTDAALDQAYTCVKIKLKTDDYIGELTSNQSQLIPLISESAYNRVRIEWFSKEDFGSAAGTSPVNLTGATVADQPLYTQATWPLNRPPVLRSQLIQFSSSFTLSNFDIVNGAQSNAASVFLYPTSKSTASEVSFTLDDSRKTSIADDPNAKTNLTETHCLSDISAGGYACTATLVLPDAINASSATDRTAYLRLQPFFNAAHFRVTLWNGPVDPSNLSNLAKFKDVQPEIDSTGRANNLFKRLVSRVDLFDTSFPYPEATIDVTGNFCKDFSVVPPSATNPAIGYISGSCTP